MSTKMLFALGLGGLSAVVSMAFLAGWPGGLLVVYLAPLPLLLAGLGGGAAAATVAGATGIMTAGLIGGAMAAGVYGLVHALPAWMVTRHALLQRSARDGTQTWFPAGHNLCWLAALGAALLVAAAMASWGAGTSVSKVISTGLDRGVSGFMPDLSAAQRQEIVGFMTPLFAGGIGTSWMIMTVVNATLAQGILATMGRNLRPSPRLADLELTGWFGWTLASAAALALMGTLLGAPELQYIGRNLAMILTVPYIFLGLAVLHALALRVPFPGMFLAVFYIVLVYFVLNNLSWIVILLAVTGMMEDWAGLRERLARHEDNRENE